MANDIARVAGFLVIQLTFSECSETWMAAAKILPKILYNFSLLHSTEWNVVCSIFQDKGRILALVKRFFCNSLVIIE